MNINLNPGEYIITADYKGLKASNNIKVLPTISAKDLTLDYKDGSKFEAKVLNGNGQPYANQQVTFNVNGVFYQRTTDSSGIARLTINLEPGTYTITSTYNGLNAANTIIVNSNSEDDSYLYIDLPSYDTKITRYIGKYTISVEQWRSPSLGEVDIIVTDSNGNIVDKYLVESKISDGSAWSDTYSGYQKAMYHKWQFSPDVRITRIAVKLIGMDWYSGSSNSNTNNGGNSNSEDSGYVYIDLPSYDTKITRKVGIYTIEVEQWRGASIGEVDIMVSEPNGNFVSKYVVESKISDGSSWSDTYSSYERAMYHKWHMDKDVRITRVAVQLLGRHWDGS